MIKLLQKHAIVIALASQAGYLATDMDTKKERTYRNGEGFPITRFVLSIFWLGALAASLGSLVHLLTVDSRK